LMEYLVNDNTSLVHRAPFDNIPRTAVAGVRPTLHDA